MGEEDLIPPARVKESTKIFLQDECTRCKTNETEKAKCDTKVSEYFYKKYKSSTDDVLKAQFFGIQEGCPVCMFDQTDQQHWADTYSNLIKTTPIFMNSPNKDPDAPDNNEANKFPMIDRYMLNYGDWVKTMSEVNKAESKMTRKDKKEKIYWRGSTSGMNQTIFGADANNVPCEKMAQVILNE